MTATGSVAAEGRAAALAQQRSFRLAPMNAKVLAARIGLRHHIDMVGASQRLTEVCDLLEQALQAIDACEDTYLSVLIDTALQEVKAKIAAANTDV